jgi:outer membrane protein TolC
MHLPLLFSLGMLAMLQSPSSPRASSTLPFRFTRAIATEADSTLARALVRAVASSARLRAARARMNAARARVGPAGARPDPMVMTGILNLPATSPNFRDEMTMKMVGITQTIPLGGKLSLSRSAAERDVDALRASVVAESLSVVAEVTRAYLDIAQADHSLALLERTHRVLSQLVSAAEVRYGNSSLDMGASRASMPGSSPTAASSSLPAQNMSTAAVPQRNAPSQSSRPGMSGGMATSGSSIASITVPRMTADAASDAGMVPTPMASGSMSSQASGSLADLLASRQALVRLGERVSAAREERAAALARFNGLIGAPTNSPLANATIPERVTRAAVAPLSQIRFESQQLGSRAADSPLPTLAQLEHLSHAKSPELRAHEAMINAQSLRVELARKSRVPDIDVSVEYGQRDHMPDMVSARVSVPLQLHRSERQQQTLLEAQADLATLEAEHEDRIRELHAQAASLLSSLERARTQLALYQRALLPEGTRIAEAQAVGFSAGRASLSDLLRAEAAQLEDRLTYERTLTDFAKSLIALEQLIGEEVVP